MPTSRAPEVETIAGVFLGLTWITACLRVYVKGFIAKSFAPEDWLAIIALVFFTATAVFALEGISHSMGLHLADVPLQNLVPAMQYWFAVELAYVLTTCTLKMSIGFFLLRIANKRSHRWTLYITMSFVILLTIAYFLFLILQCSPVDYYWNVFAGEVGSCLPAATVGALTYTHSGVNAAADIILSLLPVLIVSQLQMNPRTKITVCIILALGIVACVAVIVRIPFVKILVDDADDFLYSSTDVVIWSAIEPGLAITAANIATLRPLFSAFLSRTKLWGTTTARNKSSVYGHSKDLSGFSSRKGYMRSGSRGNTDDLALQGMDKSGLTTVVEANDYGTTKNGWGEDIENGTDLVIQGNTSNEWPAEIRKTVRLDIVSENGDEDKYASIMMKMNAATTRPDSRGRSGSARGHKMGGSIGGSRDLGKLQELQGLPRAHTRQPSLGYTGGSTQRVINNAATPVYPAMRPTSSNQTSLRARPQTQSLPRPTMNNSQVGPRDASPAREKGHGNHSRTSLGHIQTQDHSRSNMNGSQVSQGSVSSERGQLHGHSRGHSSFGHQIQTQGVLLKGGVYINPNGNVGQPSLISPVMNIARQGHESLSSFGSGTRVTSQDGYSPSSYASLSWRMSDVYQVSEGGGIRDWQGDR